MNRFLKSWRITGLGEVFQAQVSKYADDFVILSRGCAAEALNWTRSVMTRLELTLNEAKTSIKQARRERFDFLGYTFGPHCLRKDGHMYLGASPSKKSVSRLRQKVADLLVSQNVAPWTDVRDRLNRILRGWSNYIERSVILSTGAVLSGSLPEDTGRLKLSAAVTLEEGNHAQLHHQ